MQQTIERVQPGWKVWGTDDREIGEVSELGEGYVLMTKGLIFGKNLFVPEEYIERVDQEGERVYLRVGKDIIDAMGWDRAPGTTDDDVINLGPGDDGPDIFRMPR